jgi:F-type H+-transporting ATPase subunit gamma
VSRQRILAQRRETLDEIGGIMNSMKTLAYIESRRLARFLDAQRAVVAHTERVAADFLGAWPGLLPGGSAARPVFLLLGAERGFCGDFNGALLAALESRLEARHVDTPRLVVSGSRLAARLGADPRVIARLDGASVVEEAGDLLLRLSDVLNGIQAEQGAIALTVLYHDPDRDAVVTRAVLPPFASLPDTAPDHPFPPALNLPPEHFLAGLVDHHLFAALHEIVYVSLMAENSWRIRHLEGAVRHLEEKSAELQRQGNALRQEEIIEEIEVILLSAGLPESGAAGRTGPTPHRDP